MRKDTNLALFYTGPSQVYIEGLQPGEEVGDIFTASPRDPLFKPPSQRGFRSPPPKKDSPGPRIHLGPIRLLV